MKALLDTNAKVNIQAKVDCTGKTVFKYCHSDIILAERCFIVYTHMCNVNSTTPIPRPVKSILLCIEDSRIKANLHGLNSLKCSFGILSHSLCGTLLHVCFEYLCMDIVFICIQPF